MLLSMSIVNNVIQTYIIFLYCRIQNCNLIQIQLVCINMNLYWLVKRKETQNKQPYHVFGKRNHKKNVKEILNMYLCFWGTYVILSLQIYKKNLVRTSNFVSKPRRILFKYTLWRQSWQSVRWFMKDENPTI